MEKQTLADLVVRFGQLEQQIIENNGEIDGAMELLEFDLTEKLEDKVEGYALIMDRISRAADYYADKVEQYRKIHRGLNQASDFLRNNLRAAMETLNLPEVSGGSVRAKLQKCAKRVVYDGITPLNPTLCENVSKPSLERIKAALEAGAEIPGARLEGGTVLRFYANREIK